MVRNSRQIVWNVKRKDDTHRMKHYTALSAERNYLEEMLNKEMVGWCYRGIKTLSLSLLRQRGCIGWEQEDIEN